MGFILSKIFHSRSGSKKKDPPQNPVYRVPLSELMQRELNELSSSNSSSTPHYVPRVCRILVTHLEKYAIDVEFIFRIPADEAVVRSTMERFDYGDYPELTDIPDHPMLSGALLKRFCASLPESLIPASMYDAALDPTNHEPQFLQKILPQFPAVNYQLLSYIMRLLHVLSRHSAENRMNAKNLAICWWPTLFFITPTGVDALQQVKYCIEFLTILIELAPQIFPPSHPGYQPLELHEDVLRQFSNEDSSAATAGGGSSPLRQQQQQQQQKEEATAAAAASPPPASSSSSNQRESYSSSQSSSTRPDSSNSALSPAKRISREIQKSEHITW